MPEKMIEEVKSGFRRTKKTAQTLIKSSEPLIAGNGGIRTHEPVRAT
jgi:hypothetical protein